MTHDRDIERLLDAWLAEGPQQVSDRAFDDAIVRTRGQDQRPAWRLRWRDSTMSTPMRLAAAAVAVVAVVAIGLAVLPPGDSGVGTSTASPEVSATPTTGPTVLPTESPTSPPSVACTDGPCLGPLAAGTYTATEPLVPFSYTVPDGWNNPFNKPGMYSLLRTGDPDYHGIYVIPDPVAADQAVCGNIADEGVGRTVDDLVAFLTGHPGLTTSAPAPISIGGLDGQVLDVQMDPGGTAQCVSGVSLFVHRGTITDGLWWLIDPDARMHAILLDAGDGHTVLIDVESQAPDAFADLVSAATPIVESFDFPP